MTSEEKDKIRSQIERLRMQNDYIKEKINNLLVALNTNSDSLAKLLGHFPE